MLSELDKLILAFSVFKFFVGGERLPQFLHLKGCSPGCARIYSVKLSFGSHTLPQRMHLNISMRKMRTTVMCVYLVICSE